MAEPINSIEKVSELASALSMPYDNIILSSRNALNTLIAALDMISAVQSSKYFVSFASQEDIAYLNSLTGVINTFVESIPSPPASQSY